MFLRYSQVVMQRVGGQWSIHDFLKVDFTKVEMFCLLLFYYFYCFDFIQLSSLILFNSTHFLDFIILAIILILAELRLIRLHFRRPLPRPL